jgi:biopolymer transport protein ExbD
MRHRYKIDEKEFADINITPFTDVVLVLLLIFMVTSPLILSSFLKIKLPASKGDSNVNKTSVVNVFITQEHEIFIEKQKVQINQVKELMKYQFMQKGTKSVAVSADKTTLHGEVVDVINILKDAGAEKFLITTSPQKNQ